jgi:hypothetical protein
VQRDNDERKDKQLSEHPKVLPRLLLTMCCLR